MTIFEKIKALQLEYRRTRSNQGLTFIAFLIGEVDRVTREREDKDVLPVLLSVKKKLAEHITPQEEAILNMLIPREVTVEEVKDILNAQPESVIEKVRKNPKIAIGIVKKNTVKPVNVQVILDVVAELS